MLLLAIACGTAIRVQVPLGDARFDTASARGLLSTDPAFIYYVTDRIVEAGGALPDDFREDARVEHPDGSDLPAMFSIGQELYVAWTYLLLGRGMPLHLFALHAMAFFASLTVLGVYGLARELSGRTSWACVAALLYATMPVNYRTLGFVLIREDFSLPWFSLHLYLVTRAARLGTRASFGLAALATVAAAATWHAMPFVLLMEMACVLGWFVRSGENPLAARGAWMLPVGVALVSLAVPVLRAKLFFLSLPMQLALAMVLGGLAARHGRRPRGVELAFAGVSFGLLFLVARPLSALAGGGLQSYDHVIEFLGAKVAGLGVLPEDPGALSFGAKLLWQGPFQTANLTELTRGMTVGSLALAIGLVWVLPGWIRGRGDARRLLLVALGVGSAVAGYLVVRVLWLPGLVSPVVAALLLARLPGARVRLVAVLVALGLQTAFLVSFLTSFHSLWYGPPARVAERTHLIDWIEAALPEGEPVAADFVNSATILAFTRHPILQQPKYETVESRERIERYLTTFFHGTLSDFATLLREASTRYLVVDRQMMGSFWYIVGLPASQVEPTPGTAASWFLSSDTQVLAAVPGFRLLYQSPPELGLDSYWVYEMQ